MTWDILKDFPTSFNLGAGAGVKRSDRILEFLAPSVTS
jgi:hypothetical protein